MPGDEFDIIQQHFTHQPVVREDVLLGVGDDAALLLVPAGAELVVCMDTLVAGVHFSASTPAVAIGHKALAVNLSDLAAMGAEPAWATLALTLPDYHPVWLADFARGFFALADHYHVQLVGGDTTHGPLSVTVQAHGFIRNGKALRRQGAQPGDRIYVTGTLGDAGLALKLRDAANDGLRKRLDYPQPRIEAGLALRKFASAVIDVSDGLLADLGHLLERDELGARLDVDALPHSQAFLEAIEQPGPGGHPPYYELPLTAGDDYELCFTVPPQHCAAVEQRLGGLACGCMAVGVIEQAPGIRCHFRDGSEYRPAGRGYLHFPDE